MLDQRSASGIETYQYTTMRHRHTWPRRIVKVFAAPAYYLFESGQFRSILKARAVDRDGNALPMLTYPANDFLRSVESGLRDADVLEFGCGQSTKWFAPRVRSLLGVEKYDAFRDVLVREFKDDPRIRFIGSEFPLDIRDTFDIVVVDGSRRIETAKFAVTVLKDDGIIIFDNSDFQSLSEVPEHLHSLGFARVDFFGYSPTGVRKQATSIFFRSPKWFRLNTTVMPISPNSMTWKA